MEAIWAEFGQPAFWLASVQIIWINILLSGDNAVVIALACRMLPPKQRLWGMILGAGVAVVLRIVFTGIVAQLMTFPFLKLIGGLLLLWIAIKLVVPEESHGEGKVEAADSLWRAVRIVAIADIVMSLDNVIAIAGAAETAGMKIALLTTAADPASVAYAVKMTLIIFGLTTSIPLIIAGSAILMAMIDRFPVLVWAGAGLLGWVAGEIIIKDAWVAGYLGSEFVHRYEFWSASAGVVLVIGTGWLLVRRRRMAQSEV